jgi:hypothetical protein
VNPAGILVYLDTAMRDIGGCGDGGCKIYFPGGMHTNGRYSCHKDQKKMQMYAARMHYAHNLLRKYVESNP